MLKVLSWIRSYYLFFYYTAALDPIKKKLMPSRGFITTAGLVMIFPSALILFGTHHFFPFINDTMREELFTFRGSVNQMALIYVGISIALTYFVCCFRIRFEEIAPRLQQIPFFMQRSIPKCLLLMLINFVITIICMNLLYK
jgi:uncharacterized membrane protein YwzB